MAILSLHPNNKNQYRKLPLKSSCNFTSDDGYVIPDDLIVNCSITTIYGRHKIYIKQVFFKDTQVRITISAASQEPEGADVPLGVFTGVVNEDFTTITLTPFVRNVSGFLTIGSHTSLLKINRTLNFDKAESGIEESKIFCYVPPAVSSITDKKNNELRAFVNFGTLINLTKTTVTGISKFTATSPETVLNIADHSSYLGTCLHPVIKDINGVLPSPIGQDEHPQNDANIYIVGVKPIVFYGIPGTPGILNVESAGVTLNSLCTQRHKLLPPVDIRGFTENSEEAKNMYYNKPALVDNQNIPNYPYEIPARLASNFNASTRPEFYYWPQFVKKEYYAYWALIAPSAPVVITTTPGHTSAVISFSPPINKGEYVINNYEYSLSMDGNTFGDFTPFLDTLNQLTVEGLSSGTKYWVVIRAIDTASFAGQTSMPAYFTTLTS